MKKHFFKNKKKNKKNIYYQYIFNYIYNNIIKSKKKYRLLKKNKKIYWC
jgi:hypothetical protein